MKQKFLCVAVFVMAFLLCINTAEAQQKSQDSKSEKNGLPDVIAISSLGAGETDIEFVENGRKHKARLNGSKMVEMFIDDKKIPERDYVKYEPAIKKILKQMETDRRQLEKDMAQAKPNQKKAGKNRVEVVDMNRKGTKNDPAQEEKDRIQAEAERKQKKKN